MDLIDRQAAIDALMEKVTPYGLMDETGNIESGCKDRDVIAMLKDLPSVEPEPQWIPCNERMPEHGGWYIVTKNLTDDGDKAVYLSWYSLHGWECGEAPIAWMPLPEPYRGKN